MGWFSGHCRELQSRHTNTLPCVPCWQLLLRLQIVVLQRRENWNNKWSTGSISVVSQLWLMPLYKEIFTAIPTGHTPLPLSEQHSAGVPSKESCTRLATTPDRVCDRQRQPPTSWYITRHRRRPSNCSTRVEQSSARRPFRDFSEYLHQASWDILRHIFSSLYSAADFLFLSVLFAIRPNCHFVACFWTSNST